MRHSVLVLLVRTCHPLPTLLMTAGLSVGAALTGRPGAEVGLVAVTVLCGQLTIGWTNDLVDRDRDRLTGRTDKPLAQGWIEPGTVWFAVACATLVVVPLSLANGFAAGIAHLLVVAGAWAYNLLLKSTVLSWLPYAVSFGLLPAFLSYGGLGGGLHGAPPTWQMTLLAALLGIGIHVLDVLPDLQIDNRTGVRHLPLRVALRIGASRLLHISLAFTVVVAVLMVLTGLGVGLRR